VLGAEAASKNQRWEDAGGDSMKSLELTFELERGFGRRIPVQILGPYTRPSDLVESLQGDTKKVGEEQQSLVLLGSNGHYVPLLRLAHFLSRAVKVEVLDYAPISPADLRFVTLDDLVGDVIKPIRSAAQRGEPICLLGWSLGAFVAIAVARTLKAEGYTVQFVGVLDTSTTPMRWDPTNTDPDAVPALLADQVNVPITTQIRRHIRVGGAWTLRPNDVVVVALRKLLHGRQLAVVRSLWWLPTVMHLHQVSVRFRFHVTRFIHCHAVMRGAHTLSYAGPLALFRSEYQEWERLGMPDDLGWREFCAEVSVRRVRGDHWSLMAPDKVEATALTVIEAMREADQQLKCISIYREV
jgi:thioesterase domain-containing protein/acyl carrier protein